MSSTYDPSGASIQAPSHVTDDDGDVPNAMAAFFGDEWDSHIRFCLGQDQCIYLLGIWRDQRADVSGTDMVTWLRSAYDLPVRVVEVAPTAVGFWEKMLDAGLITSWTYDELDTPTAPLEDCVPEILAARQKSKPRP